jgi:hypothetical protein
VGCKVPDLATLASEALEAAEKLIGGMDQCQQCADDGVSRCGWHVDALLDYRTKKDKALKAMRGKK